MGATVNIHYTVCVFGTVRVLLVGLRTGSNPASVQTFSMAKYVSSL